MTPHAARTIDRSFVHTPQFAADRLCARLGFDMVLKVETVNPIRSFKGRGTDFLLSRLPAGVTAVACASAGNFGQGIAYAGRRRDLEVHVHASRTANSLKVQRMRERPPGRPGPSPTGSRPASPSRRRCARWPSASTTSCSSTTT